MSVMVSTHRLWPRHDKIPVPRRTYMHMYEYVSVSGRNYTIVVVSILTTIGIATFHGFCSNNDGLQLAQQNVRYIVMSSS